MLTTTTPSFDAHAHAASSSSSSSLLSARTSRRILLLLLAASISQVSHLAPSPPPLGTPLPLLPTSDPSSSSSLPQPPSLQQPQHILTPSISSIYTSTASQRYFEAHGFNVCKDLDNAQFDSMAFITVWNDTIKNRNPDMAEFTDLVDTHALKLKDVFIKAYPFLDEKVLIRFTCYCVAEARNGIAMLSDNRLLKHVDPKQYFKNWIPSIEPRPSKIPGIRRKYKLGILLMIHGQLDVLENVRLLLNELDDGSSLIFIHIDVHYKDLHNAVEALIRERESRMNKLRGPDTSPVPGNVYIADTRYHGRWGHVTLVWVQLSGFWEMMDMADVDHFINLSAFNLPLRKGREIQRILSMPKYANHSFIDYFIDSVQSASRLMRPHVPTSEHHDKDEIFYPQEAGLLYPPNPRWRSCKQHQWMILSREAVHHLRHSAEAATFLAYSEYQFIPDEAFFCYVLLNTPHLSQRLINSNKHYLSFPHNSYHPKQLDLSDIDEIGDGNSENERDDPRFLFLRKVDVSKENGRDLWEWIKERHLQRYLKSDEEYGELGGKAFVGVDG